MDFFVALEMFAATVLLARTEAGRALSWSEWQIATCAQEIHLQLTQLGPAGVAPRSGLGRGEHVYFRGQWVQHAGCFKTRKTQDLLQR